MLRSKKKQCISDLEILYNDSKSVFFVHYHGLTVAKISGLRCNLRGIGASLKVVKNTLSKIAANTSGLEISDVASSGPVAVIFSHDPVSTAKLLVEFAKNNEQLKILAGIMDRVSISLNDVDNLSKLLSFDEYRAKIVGLINAPARNLIGLLNAPATRIVGVCKAYSDKERI